MNRSLHEVILFSRSLAAQQASGPLRFLLPLLLVQCVLNRNAKGRSPLPLRVCLSSTRNLRSSTLIRHYDSYGWSVAVDGNFAVVGMPGSVNGTGPSPAAYVYRVDAGQLVRTLQPISSDSDDGFASVAISGNLVVVGTNSKTWLVHPTPVEPMFTI